MSITLFKLSCWRWFVRRKVLTMICLQVTLERGRFEVLVSQRMQEMEFGEEIGRAHV